MQKFIRKIQSYFSSQKSASHIASECQTDDPIILLRKEHNVSRKYLNKPALDVLYGLKRAGYDGYLVGGAVRDLLLGLEPKDFDVVTNATPDQVKDVFKRQCRLIGRRFRLAHVHFGRTVIEVATFRGEGQGKKIPTKGFRNRKNKELSRQVDGSGRLVRDNVYGTMFEDVWRRDFTVNSLYYNIKDFSVIDYTGGLKDIEFGQIRLIGEPEERYREDPVRMIRAIRFAAKLGFNIEKETEAAIFKLGPLLQDVSHARMFEEVLKLFHSGAGVEVFEKLRHYDLFKYLFPLTHGQLQSESDSFPKILVIESLKSTDERIQTGKGVNPSFLFAAMLWEEVRQGIEAYVEQGYTHQDALYASSADALNVQIKATAIPKRFTIQMREIWSLQYKLSKRFGSRAHKLREHPRFRAAYDFLGIRVAAGETELKELFDWWTQYQELSSIDQVAFASAVKNTDKKRRRPRKNRNTYRKSYTDNDTDKSGEE